MARPKTSDEVRKLKERGIFDVGVHYSPHGLNIVPKYRFWDRDEGSDPVDEE